MADHELIKAELVSYKLKLKNAFIAMDEGDMDKSI